jgi:hypothetical protein
LRWKGSVRAVADLFAVAEPEIVAARVLFRGDAERAFVVDF